MVSRSSGPSAAVAYTASGWKTRASRPVSPWYSPSKRSASTRRTASSGEGPAGAATGAGSGAVLTGTGP